MYLKIKKKFYFLNAVTISLLLSILLISCFLPSRTLASDPRKKLTEVERKLKEKIQQVKKALKKEKSVTSELERINKRIKEKEQELKRYDKRISQTEANIRSLKKEITTLSEKIENRKHFLKQRLNSLYKQQYGVNALILISAEDFYDLMRKSKYLNSIARHDTMLIKTYVSEINEINSKKHELEMLYEKLKIDKEKVQKMQETLKIDRIKKDKLLAMIKSKRQAYEKRIKELEESSKKLQRMIVRMKKKKIPKAITGKGFRYLKGRLPWPINGRVLIPYGKYKDPKYGITVFKNGIEIKAKPGEKAKAVAGGRVVYADWFKGYGLLLIINHGNGYHSLYGNLSEIFLKTDDILIEGTAIGRVGESRLLNVPTLYFEIRYRGKPVNPLKWLRKRY
jgi:septal ring factor EnvC (AmiA/AmiB activator)